jgi:hypothetical protein
MPVFNRPRQAIITEGSGTGEALALLLALAVPLLVVVSLVAFVLAHLVLVAVLAGVFAAVLGGYIAFTRWLASPGQFEKQFRPHRATGPAPRPARAITAPRPRAIEAAAPSAVRVSEPAAVVRPARAVKRPG